MNPRYSYSVKFYLEHGNNAPTPAEILELEKRANSMANLVFGNKLIQSPDVMVIEDEEEKDYFVTWDVQISAQIQIQCRASSKQEAIEESVTRLNQNCLHIVCLEEDDFQGESTSLQVTKYEVVGCHFLPAAREDLAQG